MEEDTTTKKPRKQDKRKRDKPPFVGFTQESIKEEYFYTPTIWINVCAEIDSLAELKVVQYIMRHTWGYQEYDTFKHITMDEFVNGRKRRDGSRIDLGTGLSAQGVLDGLALAIEHGLVACEIDDSDQGRVKKYYQLHIQKEDKIEVKFIEPDLQELYPGVKSLDPWQQESLPRSENELIEETRKKDVIRIAHPLKIFPTNEEREELEVIRIRVEDLSRTLGDHEHTGSNIRQAQKIYLESDKDIGAFVDLLGEARILAQQAAVKKVDSRGRPNRMPYFFSCLKKSLGIASNGKRA